MQDPRSRNEALPGDSVAEYLASYVDRLREAVLGIDPGQLDTALALLTRAVRQGARVYVAGNGGSAAIADHLACDWMKGTYVPGLASLKVHSLTANVALLTAASNDFGYEHGIARQVEMLGAPGDVLVLISASGNSPNVIEAAHAARRKDMTVLGLCGFDGGWLRGAADLSLYVPVKNYGIVEDAHQILMHVLAQVLARLNESGALDTGEARR